MEDIQNLNYIKGERITLIRITDSISADCLDQLFEARIESQKDLRPWMGWAQKDPTIFSIKKEASDGFDSWNNGTSFRFHIFMNVDGSKDDGKFVGSIGVNKIWNNNKCAEVGYWIRTGMHRNRYATEALSLISLYLTKVAGLARVEIRCDSDNVRSIGVACHAGFMFEGILRNDRTKMSGSTMDTYVLSIIDNRDIDFRFEEVSYKLDGFEPITLMQDTYTIEETA